MKKKSRLTKFIFLAMILGVLAGYLFNRFGGGHQVSYTGKADFTGADTLRTNTASGTITQPLFIVKDSAQFKRAKDSLTAAQIVVGGKETIVQSPDRVE